MRILISGLGVAGPTLAYWLLRRGFEPVVVERASRLRTGGYVIDFWGKAYDIAEKMGLAPRLRQHGYFIKEIRFVDTDGRRVGGFSADVFQRATNGRFVSLARAQLSAAIHETIRDKVEIIWADTIRAIDQRSGHAEVTFARAPPRAFDLVVGADGLHSNVRRLCFGDDREFETFLHYKVAAFEISGYKPRDDDVYVSYNEPKRQVARFAIRDDRTMFLFIFQDPSLELPQDVRAQKAALRKQFGSAGWECPRILAHLDACDDIYFDRVSQIRMGAWAHDRVVLVGDAAYCPSLLAGEGAALAMIGAYVLAGELRRAMGDLRAALANYEALMRPFITEKQAVAARFASSFAPRTSIGIAVRNLATRAFAAPLVADLLLGRSLRDRINLPEYTQQHGRRQI